MLAVFAVVTAVFAFLAFRKQSAEVRLLQEQAGRDIEQRRKAQAAKVFVIVGGLTPDLSDEICLRNHSEQPVYDLVASSPGRPELQRVPCVLPGDVYPFFAGIQDPDGKMPLVCLDFRDAAGVRWRTTSRGELTETRGADG